MPPPTAVAVMAMGHGLFKADSQVFANETGLTIPVSHFLHGASQGNAIEHELFRAIGMN